MATKEILPYSYLVLYAKGWIRFPWIKYEGDTEEYYYKTLKTLLKMCGFSYLNKNDVLTHVLIATDKLRELYNKNNLEFNYMIDSYYSLIHGAKDYQISYQLKSFDLSLIRYCLSAFSMLNINEFAIKYIPYKKLKIKTMGNDHPSAPYTQSQNRFNKMFKDLLIPQSYDIDEWWMKDLKNI